MKTYIAKLRESARALSLPNFDMWYKLYIDYLCYKGLDHTELIMNEWFLKTFKSIIY